MFYRYFKCILLLVFLINSCLFVGISYANTSTEADLYEENYDDEYDDYAEEYDASKKQVNDPFEKFNRKVFDFNLYILESFFIPAGNMFKKITNQFVRDRISNVATTLREPIVTANSILELDFKNTLKSLATLGTNLTIGCLGLFNPAKNMPFYREKRTFADTFKFYGIPDGPYLVLPFLGSSSIRNSFSSVVEFYFNPISVNYLDIFNNRPWIDNKEFNISLFGVDMLNKSIDLKGIYEGFVKKSLDPYLLAREYYYNKN